MTRLMPVDAHTVDIRTAPSLEPSEAERTATLLACLADDERARVLAITHPRTRADFLLGRALLRTTLSRFDARPPAAWRLTANPHGRPELVPGQCDLDLRFNIAHTRGLVVCSVALGRAVGIDVEHVAVFGERHGLHRDVAALARRFLAPDEAEDVCHHPESTRTERYLRYWTLRESYVKAHGLGLSMPTHGLAFVLEPSGGIRIDGDAAARWRCWQWRPTSDHILALTAEFATREPAEFRVDDVMVRSSDP